MSGKKKALAAQINQDLASSPPAEDPGEGTPPAPKRKRERTVKAVSKKGMGTKRRSASTATGKPGAFWLDDSDRRIFHELGMLLYSQGIRPSDSLILRAAIRLMPRDHRFIEQIRKLQSQDGRKIRHHFARHIGK
jgi:hypothetical protein